MNAATLQAAVDIIARCTRAQARIEGMTAENMQREAHGYSMAYTEADFLAVISEYHIADGDIPVGLQAAGFVGDIDEVRGLGPMTAEQVRSRLEANVMLQGGVVLDPSPCGPCGYNTDGDSDACACFPAGREACPDYVRRVNEAAISQEIQGAEHGR